MSYRPAEVSSFPAPDPGQSSALMWRTPSLRGTAEPRFGPPPGPRAPEHTPRPLKTFITRFSHYWIPIASVSTLILVVLLIVSVIGRSADQTPPDENGVAILGVVTEFDWLVTQQLSVTWFIVGHGEYELQATDGKSNDITPVNRAVDVYLNDAANPAFSYDPALLPTVTTGDIYAPENLISFDMQHRVTMDKKYYAPFARYDFVAFAFVIDKATNQSIPITVLAAGDSGPADFTTQSTDTPSRSNFTYNATGGPATVEVDSRMMFSSITHSLRAAALIFLMFCLCWVLSLWSVWIAWSVSRQGMEVKDGVAFLPITLIFSIPTIRSLYIGSLPFGVFLDVIGLFPQMLILLICAAKVLNVAMNLSRSTQNRSSPFEGEKA